MGRTTLEMFSSREAVVAVNCQRVNVGLVMEEFGRVEVTAKSG